MPKVRTIPRSNQEVKEVIQEAKTTKDKTPAAKCPLTGDTSLDIDTFLPLFINAMTNTDAKLRNQTKLTKTKNGILLVSYRLLVQFLGSLNSQISLRGAPYNSGFRAEDRNYYGLPVDSSKLPNLSTQSDVLFWMSKIIEGEKQRVLDGGIPIELPSVIKLELWYGNLVDVIGDQSVAKNEFQEAETSLRKLREDGQAIYKNICADCDNFYRDMDAEAFRRVAATWGVLYKNTGSDPTKFSYVQGRVTSDTIPLHKAEVVFSNKEEVFRTNEYGLVSSSDIPVGLCNITVKCYGYIDVVINNYKVLPNVDNYFVADMQMIIDIEPVE